MDIISYSLAKKHQKMILKYHKDEVGLESEAEFSSLDHRLDELERLLKDMRIDNRLEISTLIDGLLSTRLGKLYGLEYTDDNSELRLAAIGKHFRSNGYWESPILDIFDGFEKVSKETRVTTENLTDKIKVMVRTAPSLYAVEHQYYVPLGSNTVLKKYTQFKLEFSSSNLAPTRKIKFDFSNRIPRLASPDYDKQNLFYKNHFIHHTEEKMEIGKIVDAYTYLNQDYQGEGYVYEVEFFADEFRALNGIEHRNNLFNGPGPEELIAGHDDHGFYGKFDASELMTSTELIQKAGLQGVGEQINPEAGWLKWEYKGATLFMMDHPVIKGLDLYELENRGLIYGDKIITDSNGNRYKLRLPKGANRIPAPGSSQPGAPGSEWNALFFPLLKIVNSLNGQNPYTKDHPEPNDWNINYETWEVGFSENTNNNPYAGYRTCWCQEPIENYNENFLVRGGANTAAYFKNLKSNKNSESWHPVLEIIPNYQEEEDNGEIEEDTGEETAPEETEE